MLLASMVLSVAASTIPSAVFASEEACLLASVRGDLVHPGEDPAAHLNLFAKTDLHFSHPVEFGGAKYTFSDFIPIEGGRVGVFGVVEVGREKYLRFFYKSNSSNEFRVLPAYNDNIPGRPGYDKGGGAAFEPMLSLPADVQTALFHRLTSEPIRNDISLERAQQLYQGAVPVNHSVKDYKAYLARPNHIQKSVKALPLLARSETPLKDILGWTFKRPEDVQIAEPGKKPDFSKIVRRDSMVDSRGRQVEVLDYTSKDRSRIYSMRRYQDGKIYFANVYSAHAKVNEFGISSEFVESGELTMPLYEYSNHIPKGYRGVKDPLSKEIEPAKMYRSAWPYIRRMPLVREWYEANHLPIPEDDGVMLGSVHDVARRAKYQKKLYPQANIYTSFGHKSLRRDLSDFHYSNPPMIEGGKVPDLEVHFSFGATKGERAAAALPRGESKFLGSGGTSDTYLVEMSSDTSKQVKVKKAEGIVVKVKQPDPFEHKAAESDYGIETAAGYMTRELALHGVAENLTARATLGGKRFIRAAEVRSTPDDLKKGRTRFEPIAGPSIEEIRISLAVLSRQVNQRNAVSEEIANAWKTLERSGLPKEAEKDSRSGGFRKFQSEMLRKIAAVEMFFQKTHPAVLSYVRENHLWGAIATGPNGAGASTGFDYNHGSNVLWDPKTQMFVMVDF
jgi:hypothetical protein